MSQEYPKLLVISHNAFSMTSNNGKTFSSIFGGWPKERIAQLFFQNEVPDFTVCDTFYYITDEEMISKSKQNIGSQIFQNTIELIKKSNSPIHNYARKKPLSIFSFARNIVWSTNRWKNDKLKDWIYKFKPEAIFFVGGETTFSYKITNFISQELNIPVFLYYTDDYITPIKTLDLFWWINYLWLKNSLNNLLPKVNSIFVIGEEMKREYSSKLQKKCIPIMNAIDVQEYIGRSNEINTNNESIRLAYFGGLHLNRWQTLLAIAESIEKINTEKHINMSINIYTGTILDGNIIQKFAQYSCVRFKGTVTEKEIIDEMQKFELLIHVESFDKQMISKTRLSISTKIPEYLASGRVILGVGPNELSSIKYLNSLGCTYIIDSLDKGYIKDKLENIILNKNEFTNLAQKGVQIAQANHSIGNNRKIIKQSIVNGINSLE